VAPRDITLSTHFFSSPSEGEISPSALNSVQIYLDYASIANDIESFPDEFLYGRAGYLYGLLALEKEFGESLIPKERIENIAHTIIESGRSYVREGRLQRRGHIPPMFWKFKSRNYLGGAHGALGILHTLLLCPAAIWSSDESIMRDISATLDFILSLWSESSKNFPMSLQSDPKYLVHWCHGATGAVFAFTLAFSKFGYTRYLDAAISAGETVWEKGLLFKGPGIIFLSCNTEQTSTLLI